VPSPRPTTQPAQPSPTRLLAEEAEASPPACPDEEEAAAAKSFEHSVGEEGLPSLGSAKHASGDCRRCNFFTKGRCQNGLDCPFCHLPHERRKLSRQEKRDARAARQSGKQEDGEDEQNAQTDSDAGEECDPKGAADPPQAAGPASLLPPGLSVPLPVTSVAAPALRQPLVGLAVLSTAAPGAVAAGIAAFQAAGVAEAALTLARPRWAQVPAKNGILATSPSAGPDLRPSAPPTTAGTAAVLGTAPPPPPVQSSVPPRADECLAAPSGEDGSEAKGPKMVSAQTQTDFDSCPCCSRCGHQGSRVAGGCGARGAL